MPSGCCVPGCVNQKGGFTFPHNNKIRRSWIASISRVIVDTKGKKKLWNPGKDSRVCEDHFVQNDFKNFTARGKITDHRNYKLRCAYNLIVVDCFPFLRQHDVVGFIVSKCQ